jgi:uncharacterized integral membrane protein
MRIIFWIIALPVVAIAMAFAVSNHESVTIDLWPAAYRLDVPIYIAVTGALFLGFLVGVTWGWLGSLRARNRARGETKRANKLALENEELRHKLTHAENAARSLPPVSSAPSQAALRHIAGGGM